MNADKLADALRAFPEDPNPFTYRRAYAKAQAALAEYDAQPAQAAQPLAEALQVIERYALDGHVMHGDDIERMHAIADKLAPGSAQPVAWTRQDTINDDDGRPIGMDEPRVVWGAECPDPGESWMPLYAEPTLGRGVPDDYLASVLAENRARALDMEWDIKNKWPKWSDDGAVLGVLCVVQTIQASLGDLAVRLGFVEHLEAAPQPPAQPVGVPDVGAMVDRFLSWPLPKDFAPDCWISFRHTPDARGYAPTWPIGTNLFTADQAKAMFEYVLAGKALEAARAQEPDAARAAEGDGNAT